MKYGVIYADPPWHFSTYSSLGMGRSAAAWYDCMSIDEIKALPVENLADDDCVLLLWTTDPFLKIAFDIIESWGFIYKTVGFYWVKEPLNWFGTGYWSRANPEQCLLATHGSPKRKSAGVPKLIVAPRREHSRKPDEARNRIESLCHGPYVELFARQRVEGWDVLGNEVDLGPRVERKWSSKQGPRKQTLPTLNLKF